MINMIISIILWGMAVGVVIIGTFIGVLLMWVTQFDKKLKQQAWEREQDG